MIEEIVKMIVTESDSVENPDRVSRLYTVSMRVDRALEDLMDNIRDQERRRVSDENKG